MRTLAMLLLTGSLLTPAFPQDKPVNRAVYKVEFTIRDSSPAAAQSSRRYTMLVESDGRGVFRLGNRVPYITGGSLANTSATLVNAQYNYAEIGVNIDCRVREVNSKVSLSTNLEISSVVPYDKGAPASGPNPTIANTRIEVTTELEAGKPAIIATVDDPVTQRKLDIEAVATKVN
jgi:hypothetical protein